MTADVVIDELSPDGAMERGRGTAISFININLLPSAHRLINFYRKRVKALPHTIQKQQ